MEALEGLTPERFGFRKVLRLQPRDIVAERARLFRLEIFATAIRAIEIENLLEHQRTGPAVQQQVMRSPNQLASIIARLKESETHQRRFRQFKAALLTFAQKSF